MDNHTEWTQKKVSARRRSGREIDEWIERFRQSDQSAAGFASAHGIRVGTLRGWLYRRGRGVKAGRKAMIPVKLIDSAGRQPAVTLRLPSGIEIEFAAAVAVSTLQELIESGARRC